MDFAQRLDSLFRRRFCAGGQYARTVRRWRFAFRQLTAEDVEDGIQAAFESVYGNHLDAGRVPETEEALEALINRAIRNKLIDKLRSRIREPLDRFPEDPGDAAEDDDRLFGAFVRIDDELAVKDLLAKIYDRLEEKWQKVVRLMLVGCDPDEIGAQFEQNGYVLRRWVRNRICRILQELAGLGDPMAGDFHGRCCV
ncbi:MAG TPA: hypothetical protein VM689_09315 [Aliidongia sp.]|nr:hypothetical protein [Aliidongia sp.]